MLPSHPVRVALLDLLAEVGTVTSTEPARKLGHSSGVCSFHLRQLARHGLIEEVPRTGGRARPWRLRWERPGEPEPSGFETVSRELEDESYQQWLSHREQAPPDWQRDETFNAVVYLSPAEFAAMARSIRDVVEDYESRARRPATGARPVAAVVRLFPLLTESSR
jgi:hypothetical protein